MPAPSYVIATIRPWNILLFEQFIAGRPGSWHLVTEREQLTVDRVRELAPRYVFFPHWSYMVPEPILALTECVCFHETDVPYGRGGSPVQNLIARGHRETMLSALRMEAELDAGPVYMKEHLSLEGGGEEIFIRAARLVAGMIERIVRDEPTPVAQTGTAVVFKRRTPNESQVGPELTSLGQLFDHIRMLDAEGYPKAFVEVGEFRYELSRPALRSASIDADVKITRIKRPR
jgi:methionyl-tRNA formyltransferase